jgi:hypothetical protein
MGRPKGHAPSNTKGSPGYVWMNNGVEEKLVRPGTVLEGSWVCGRLYDLESAREASAVSPLHYRKYDLVTYRWRDKNNGK